MNYNNINFLKNINDTKKPCKLVKKDLIISTSNLIKIKKLNFKTTRNISIESEENKNNLNLKRKNGEKSDKNKKINDKKKKTNNKAKDTKDKTFKFKYPINKSDTEGPLFTVKINYKDLLNYQNN